MAKKPLSVLKDDGSTVKTHDPGFSDATALRAYRNMVTARAFDERALNLQRQGRIGFFAPATGQEAAQVGSALALEDRDWIFPAYRELAVALVRGMPLVALMGQLFGNQLDENKGRQMPNHYGYRDINYVTPSSPIGTHIIHCTGWALAARLTGKDAVAISYFGDGATSSNDFHTGLNFAGVYRAPAIFICQNNGWAISLPVEKQTAAETLAQKADAYGVEGIRVDGNDVLAMYVATHDRGAHLPDGSSLLQR
jgi:2-oxoisovalerate dehydrogenase E1 component alpha subunit